MSLPLSPAAQEAISAASTDALFRGDGHVTPEHLLVALLAPEDGAAGRFLKALSVNREALRERVDQCLAREEEAGEMEISHLVSSATALAAEYRATTVVPEHFLLAIARQPSTAAGQLLAGLGATEEKIAQLIEAGLPDNWRGPQPPPEQAGASATVAAALTFLGLTLLALVWGGMGLTSFGSFVRASDAPIVLKLLWGATMSLVTSWPFLVRERWGWASCAGFLFAEAASSTVWFTASLFLVPRRIPTSLLFWNPFLWNALVVWLVTAGCFASRACFCIKPRERWRALMQEGGWALTSTAVVEAVITAWLAWEWWGIPR